MVDWSQSLQRLQEVCRGPTVPSPLLSGTSSSLLSIVSDTRVSNRNISEPEPNFPQSSIPPPLGTTSANSDRLLTTNQPPLDSPKYERDVDTSFNDPFSQLESLKQIASNPPSTRAASFVSGGQNTNISSCDRTQFESFSRPVEQKPISENLPTGVLDQHSSILSRNEIFPPAVVHPTEKIEVSSMTLLTSRTPQPFIAPESEKASIIEPIREESNSITFDTQERSIHDVGLKPLTCESHFSDRTQSDDNVDICNSFGVSQQLFPFLSNSMLTGSDHMTEDLSLSASQQEIRGASPIQKVNGHQHDDELIRNENEKYDSDNASRNVGSRYERTNHRATSNSNLLFLQLRTFLRWQHWSQQQKTRRVYRAASTRAARESANRSERIIRLAVEALQSSNTIRVRGKYFTRWAQYRFIS
eukprot:TRINITY_DN38017_c0_g1_i1.p1 TRINITY_DN38017_c0_g1~~TRINITY_DN38017_c0_g1_i1.p1  ORF type:complete len:416 (+),score=54.97 TRINITY_DN38017_c0_g1_i1:43-1290(+)